jgi:hypothetical protein
MIGPASRRKNFGLELIGIQIEPVPVEAVLHHSDSGFEELGELAD